ncbi:class I SAM-dependent methyltransferase [Clostridium sp. BJN0001]|uniref:tRNA (mnm(5)s(2)U34)-methyltransferase n=1 Tax=Clostridium sp. BJN0001 TaxID=2930219 RepID=UPI001FD558F5|nr:class I SAM-dependent methyltransferase [Clostridium sp. BJN0001]
MFKYVSDISEIAHYIIDNFEESRNVAVDATLGNGHDTDFLQRRFKRVFAFDVQKNVCQNYNEKENKNVKVINDSHEKIKEYVKENCDVIMYNLGFLPGGEDKSITTKAETSLKSIIDGLTILNHGGMMSIAIYRGHSEGKNEEKVILNYLKEIPKGKYGVMYHSFFNRSDDAPLLVIVEKK